MRSSMRHCMKLSQDVAHICGLERLGQEFRENCSRSLRMPSLPCWDESFDHTNDKAPLGQTGIRWVCSYGWTLSLYCTFGGNARLRTTRALGAGDALVLAIQKRFVHFRRRRTHESPVSSRVRRKLFPCPLLPGHILGAYPSPLESHSAIRALAGRGINPSLNKIISEEVYVKVAEGRRARWPIDGESCDSDSIVMWNAQSCELRQPGCG